MRWSPWNSGLMGTLLRYPYEVRDEKEYFDDIQDVIDDGFHGTSFHGTMIWLADSSFSAG